jgi:hypothetical protein
VYLQVHRLMRKSSLGLLVLILLMSLAFAPLFGSETSAKDKAEKQPNWSKRWEPSPTAKDAVLIVDMNGSVFRIPRDYLTQNLPKSPAFDVSVYWPAMVPQKGRSGEPFEVADLIRLLFRLDLHRWKAERANLLERAIQRGWVKEPKPSTRYAGLLEYRNSTTDKPWLYRAVGSTVLTPSGNPLVIACDEGLRTFGPGY